MYLVCRRLLVNKNCHGRSRASFSLTLSSFAMLLEPIGPLLFPYTTLFRSDALSYGVSFATTRSHQLARGAPACFLSGISGWFSLSLGAWVPKNLARRDRKSTRLNSSHRCISYAVVCLLTKIVTGARARAFP